MELWFVGDPDDPNCGAPTIMCYTTLDDGTYYAWLNDGSIMEINTEGIVTFVYADGSAVSGDAETGEILATAPSGTFITGGKMECGDVPRLASAKKAAEPFATRLSKSEALKPGAPKGAKMNMAVIEVGVAGKKAAVSRGEEAGTIVKQFHEAMSPQAVMEAGEEEGEDDDKLTKGELGGMIAGIVVFALLVAVVCVFLFCFRAGAKKGVPADKATTEAEAGPSK